MAPHTYRTTDVATDGGEAITGRTRSGDEGSGGAAAAPDSGTAASLLDVSAFLTASDETGLWQAQVAAENPTDRPVTAAFAATVSPAGSGGEIRSEPARRTVPAGGRGRFRLDLADPAAVRFDLLTAVVFGGFRLRISANGVPVPETAPDGAGTGPRIDPTADGCAYPFGLDETHLAVEYAGKWDGVVGVDGDQRTIDRRSADFGAPTGDDTSYVRVDGDAGVVTANVQKWDGSDDPLTVRIVRRGRVVDEATATSGYGVAVAGAIIGDR